MGEAKRKRAAAMKLIEAGGFFGVGIPETSLSDPNKITLAGITLIRPGIGIIANQMLDDLGGAIISRYGKTAFISTKVAAAIHEAGHAVVYMALGLKVTSSHIQRGIAGWIGYTEAPEAAFFITDGDAKRNETLLRRAKFLLAGVTAEKLFDPDHRAGSSLDEIVMAQILAMDVSVSLGEEPETRRERILAEVTAILTKNERVAREIGISLLKGHSLSGAELERWSGQVIGE